jgi:NADPH2:quinone reductase
VKAWRAMRYGAPGSVMVVDDVPVPEPTANEVLIRVSSFSLNWNDLDMIYGRYASNPVVPPFIPGMEVLGLVERCGPGAESWLGRRVAALPTGARGGYAEVVTAPLSMVFEMPEDIPEPEAAAIYMPFHLAWLGVRESAKLREGETLLVHAAAGGAGSAALQLGVQAGARVIAVVGSSEKSELCMRLGADLSINSNTGDFVSEVLDATQGRGVDVAFDAIGGTTTKSTFSCMAFQGRHVLVGFSSGAEGQDEGIVPRPVIYGNFSLHGVCLGYVENPTVVKRLTNGFNFPSRRLGESIHEQLLALVRAGHVLPVVGLELGFDSLLEGLEALEQRRTVGRVIVRV